MTDADHGLQAFGDDDDDRIAALGLDFMFFLQNEPPPAAFGDLGGQTRIQGVTHDRKLYIGPA